MQEDGIRKARGIEVGNGAVAGGDLKDEDDPGLDMVLGGNLGRCGEAAVMDAVRGDIQLEVRVAGNGLIHGEMSAPAKKAGGERVIIISWGRCARYFWQFPV